MVLDEEREMPKLSESLSNILTYGSGLIPTAPLFRLEGRSGSPYIDLGDDPPLAALAASKAKPKKKGTKYALPVATLFLWWELMSFTRSTSKRTHERSRRKRKQQESAYSTGPRLGLQSWVTDAGNSARCSTRCAV